MCDGWSMRGAGGSLGGAGGIGGHCKNRTLINSAGGICCGKVGRAKRQPELQPQHARGRAAGVMFAPCGGAPNTPAVRWPTPCNQLLPSLLEPSTSSSLGKCGFLTAGPMVASDGGCVARFRSSCCTVACNWLIDPAGHAVRCDAALPTPPDPRPRSNGAGWRVAAAG